MRLELRKGLQGQMHHDVKQLSEPPLASAQEMCRRAAQFLEIKHQKALGEKEVSESTAVAMEGKGSITEVFVVLQIFTKKVVVTKMETEEEEETVGEEEEEQDAAAAPKTPDGDGATPATRESIHSD